MGLNLFFRNEGLRAAVNLTDVRVVLRQGGQFWSYPNMLTAPNSLVSWFLVPDTYVEGFACFHEQLIPPPKRGSLAAKPEYPSIVGRDALFAVGGSSLSLHICAFFRNRVGLERSGIWGSKLYRTD